MQPDQDKQEFRLTLIFAILLGVLSVGYRLVPPYLIGPIAPFAWNMMPIGALALFAGSRLPGKWSWLLPLGAMVVADLLLIPVYAEQGIDSLSWTATPFIYASFVIYALLGMVIPRESRSPWLIGGMGIAGAVQFFLITNLASWLFGVSATGEPYQKTLPGLIDCFVSAVPFFRGTFAGDLIFPAVFFTAHALLLSAYRSSPAREAV